MFQTVEFLIERMAGLNQKCSRLFKTTIHPFPFLSFPFSLSFYRPYDTRAITQSIGSSPLYYTNDTPTIFKDSQRFAWIPFFFLFRRQYYTPRNAFWEKSFNIEKNMGVYIVFPICRSVEFEIAFFFPSLFFSFSLYSVIDTTCLT